MTVRSRRLIIASVFFLSAIVVAGVIAGSIAFSRHQQQESIAALRSSGAALTFAADAENIHSIYALSLDSDVAIPPATTSIIPRLTNLQELYLEGKGIDDSTLVATQDLPAIRRIVLVNTGITNLGLQHLTKARVLEEVSLLGGTATEDYMRTFARLPTLRSLKFARLRIDAQGFQHLKECPKLSQLSIMQCQGFGFKELQIICSIPSLQSIELVGVTIQPKTISLNSESQIRHLSANASTFSEEAFSFLGSIKSLESLDLSGSNLDDNTSMLFRCANGLRRINVSFSNVTEKGVLAIAEKHPSLEEIACGPDYPADLKENIKQILPHCKVIVVNRQRTQ